MPFALLLKHAAVELGEDWYVVDPTCNKISGITFQYNTLSDAHAKGQVLMNIIGFPDNNLLLKFCN